MDASHGLDRAAVDRAEGQAAEVTVDPAAVLRVIFADGVGARTASRERNRDPVKALSVSASRG